MSDQPKGKPRGLKGGRKKLGEDRGGLVLTSVQLFADQAARLEREGQGQGWLIRAAVDLLLAQLDKQKRRENMKTLFVNNETLGSECYIGTWSEWEQSLQPTPMNEWYQDYCSTQQQQAEELEECPEILNFEEWAQDCLKKGLSEATNEEISRYQRLVV